jgi:UDP-N-acetylglucosamine--N-acetylmuramyl-(pentapeptide) pyrophosphoryl-undecaprenol N-acetylglucosamine transferase
VVISRAGAIAIAELSAVGKPVIFIPLPTAAEDHQMKNARKLADTGAALVLHDRDARERLAGMLFSLLEDTNLQERLSLEIRKFATYDADKRTAEEIIKLMKK